MTNSKYPKYLLLTGAGFSKEFGAPLAKDMPYLIYNKLNHLTPSPLREKLRQQDFTDYEEAYESFVREDDPGMIAEFSGVLKDIYNHIDKIERAQISEGKMKQNLEFKGSHLFNENGYLKEHDCFRVGSIFTFGNLLQALSLRGGIWFFTLNQDLLVEQMSTSFDQTPWHSLPLSKSKFTSGKYVGNETILSQEDLSGEEPDFGDKIPYFKLHGSMTWTNENGALILTGKRKEDTISRIPRLRKYFEWFNEALLQAEHLIITGYGFRDNHINEAFGNCSVGKKSRMGK